MKGNLSFAIDVVLNMTGMFIEALCAHLNAHPNHVLFWIKHETTNMLLYYYCIINTYNRVYNMYPIVSLFPANVTITIFTPCFVVDVFLCCKEKRTRAFVVLSFVWTILLNRVMISFVIVGEMEIKRNLIFSKIQN